MSRNEVSGRWSYAVLMDSTGGSKAAEREKHGRRVDKPFLEATNR
jgi:hypothetical protein